MRQVNMDQWERLLRCASVVVDLPRPAMALFMFFPDRWHAALRELASAVNDIRISREPRAIYRVIGATKAEGSDALLLEVEAIDEDQV